MITRSKGRPILGEDTCTSFEIHWTKVFTLKLCSSIPQQLFLTWALHRDNRALTYSVVFSVSLLDGVYCGTCVAEINP